MHAGDRPKNIQEWMRQQEAAVQDLGSRVRGSASGYSAGNATTTTDAGGRASFLFGRSYGTPPVVTVTGGNGELVAIYFNTVTTTGFTAVFRGPTGALLASTSVRCLWQALPATT